MSKMYYFDVNAIVDRKKHIFAATKPCFYESPEFISHIRKDVDGNIIDYQSNYVAKGSKQYNEQAGLLTDNQWIEETFETVTSCHALKMLAEDGNL